MASGFAPTIRIILLVAIFCSSGGSRCRSCGGTEKAQSVSIKGASPQVATITLQNAYACPPAGVSTSVLAENETGHHRVILSWNKSIEPSGQPSVIDGYCLYRSTTPNVAKQDATCRECERVSERSLVGTTCTDTLVQDDKTYYYVVTAIRNNHMSSSSNEERVVIPPKTQPPPANVAPPPPSCRSTSSPS